MLNSILSSTDASAISVEQFLICTAVSLVLGIMIALVHCYKNRASKNFLLTLAILPVIVQVVITIVNGNLGTGVAVMGAFSLVRFRSVPGNSREIGNIFLAMAIGLANGMGYVGIAVLLFVIVSVLQVLLMVLPIIGGNQYEKDLKITIPENLDYQDIFDDVFETYAASSRLDKVRTVNMGSLYELHYRVVLKDQSKEKAFLDDLRCRNGNLTISCGRPATDREEL
ncbi:DUF4956 domain-containing protein [Muricomes intestini]|jgi:hypothetical protein|uniref:Uncharacterized protein DUF4956 n=2 Tax=Muricomes intestini TaxID=1796634 RepID=A0A4R3K4D8_9FIRM|nr:DUF4956 domain-containing protein [Muricomes intestini]TCS77521.1 uncharacterized protein DUF4956 [Muricomes intestini]